jgi:hypothetical protein
MQASDSVSVRSEAKFVLTLLHYYIITLLIPRFSKHPYIAGSSTVNTLNDGTPATVTYTENRNNRFK